MPKSKRKIKQQKRRAEKRAHEKTRGREEPSGSPAEELLARIALERRVRHEHNSKRFRAEQERLWLAEERSRARKGRKVKG